MEAGSPRKVYPPQVVMGLQGGAVPHRVEGGGVPEGDTSAAHAKKERKVRTVWAVPFHAESEKNMLLVQEVLKQKPFSVKFGQVKVVWDSISAALNEKEAFDKSQCVHSNCHNQVKRLLDYWERRRAVPAQLQNKLTDWEVLLEKMLKAKHEVEHQKSMSKPQVVSDHEKIEIERRGGSLNKRPRLELNNGGVLETALDAAANPGSNEEIMAVLAEHTSSLRRIQEVLSSMRSAQDKILLLLEEQGGGEAHQA
ncbi:hypothetical protein HOP50_07g46920 [Chloropicon primus]|uniref:Uncharacterized protein n=1 Tax=Chloropicon primus TaxID=1764295 RepID=A0A5B8MS91_9CHLO|nr:hypothetical protein A3770_07p46700 [Chloropicon primus]UPR01370.1 hypothetical protein HOP50_07g46920 [Chloropicon primus]|mmetsp:Transcript_13753/g.38755  ORF Transcript_13753/g.38755 Transcript_13753/m.38755 type:complete len:253 (-) Transcript_13753:938-1696(-)|eukprot:QDZ22152.1 hypothetical protein A3770_07p46700 [Chloropicon primus]